MSRYYYGDIEGKFWFGIQSSTVGERFGMYDITPTQVEYTTNNLEECQKELKVIENKLGPALERCKQYVDVGTYYPPEALKTWDITESDLSEYADWVFGKQVEECIIKQGTCTITCDI